MCQRTGYCHRREVNKGQADQIKDPSQHEDFTTMHECSISQMPSNTSLHDILKKQIMFVFIIRNPNVMTFSFSKRTFLFMEM